MQTRIERYAENGRPFRITARYGLSWLRGNVQPYFSVTADINQLVSGRWVDRAGGCLHEDILQHWPDLAPLIALHLAYADGEPMHAYENGWYWLAGCLDIGERYHGGNSTPARSSDECLRVFANHCRIGAEQATAILLQVRAARLPVLDLDLNAQRAAMRARWREICATLRPRWAHEAATAIKQFGLDVPTRPE